MPKVGIHVHEQANLELIRQLAYAGKIAGLTVLNNTDFANEMSLVLPYVVLRIYGVERMGFVEYHAIPSVIYQFDNEQNDPYDSGYYMDIARTAVARNRKVVLFNDSVGWTEVWVWERRLEVLRYMMQHINLLFVGIHMYGDVTWGDSWYKPMIDPNDPAAFHWFFGRLFWQYEMLPANARPYFIATEAGAGGFQLNATLEQWLADIRRVEDYVALIVWFLAFMLWTAGGGGAYGFERDKIDGYLPALLR